ncbi:MAG: hypothetical protein ABI608_11050 [Rhizomicrobium sp.]
MSDSKSARKRDAAIRTQQGISQIWEDRKTLAKQEMAAANAASEAKTIRLRALRLQKEQEEAEAARLVPEKPPAPKKRAIRRFIAG